MVTCGCGAVVPDETGARHRYMVAEPDCWRSFGEFQARLFGGAVSGVHVADSYAAQHPSGSELDPRRRQSVAVHLVALCLHLDHQVRLDDLHRLRGRVSARVLPHLEAGDWPVLAPPDVWGPWNAATALAVPDDRLAEVTREWPAQVWASWSAHHDVVHRWSALVLAGERR